MPSLSRIQQPAIDTSAQYMGFKNRIINGAMVIDQRNAGASVTPANGAYTLDRWIHYNAGSKYTSQRNAGGVTPPPGFTNYLGITSLSSYSVPAGEIYTVMQRIEGFNTADFGWGTVNAIPATLSFWVRSSLTGTFGGSVFSGAEDRCFPFTYSITSANTWTQVAITIPAITTGTFSTGSSTGLSVCFGLGVGNTYSGTAGAWTSTSSLFSATGATSVVGTSGATFYITGVQLEKGSTATSFDYRPYGTELSLCQRYYWKNLYSAGNAPTLMSCAIGYNTTQVGQSFCKLPVTMRASPTSTIASLICWNGAISNAVSSIATTNNSVDVGVLNFNTSGITTGGAYNIISTTLGAYVDFSAEL